MKHFNITLIIFSLIIGSSLLLACSNGVNFDNWNSGELKDEAELVYITINQIDTDQANMLNEANGEEEDFFSSNEHYVEIIIVNPSHRVKEVQLNICDVDNYLTFKRCDTTDRTTDFLCRSRELDNGCCEITLFSIDPVIMIEEGTGPIFILQYEVSGAAPSGECRDLNLESVSIIDPDRNPLDVISLPGEFCFGSVPPLCEVTISPESTEVHLGNTTQFNASTIGTGCYDSCYVWEVAGSNGSTIDSSGLYTAGNIAGTDIVTVIDECNENISDTATITLLDSDNEDDVDSTVIIDGCDSGVENKSIDDEFTMSELITICADIAKNHGVFISCVADLTNEWKRGGLITGKEKGAIQRCAAQSDIP